MSTSKIRARSPRLGTRSSAGARSDEPAAGRRNGRPNPFFVTRAKLIAALAARHGLPAIYARREFAAAGGLMSYGYDVGDGYRQMGNYAGRISAADHWAVSRSAYSPS
jgi:hypothetical protein